MTSVLRHVILTLVNIGVAVKEICAAPKRFYQYISYGKNGGRMCIETPVFQCEKLVKSNFNDGLQIAIPSDVLEELIKLDNHIFHSFKLPDCVPDKWKTVPTPYKRIEDNKYPRIYFKIDKKLRVFNFDRQEISPSELGEGDYKAVIKITGIYIGSHGELEKYASLQARVLQLMFRPSFGDDCMFRPAIDKVDDLHANAGSPLPPSSPSFDVATSAGLPTTSMQSLAKSGQQNTTVSVGEGGRKRKTSFAALTGSATAQDRMQLTLDFKTGKKKLVKHQQKSPEKVAPSSLDLINISTDDEEGEERKLSMKKKKLVQPAAPTIMDLSGDDADN